MRYVSDTYTVAFHQLDAKGRRVEVDRFPASRDMAEAYRLAPAAILAAARRNRGSQAVDGLRILCPAGTTVFQYPTAASPRDGVD